MAEEPKKSETEAEKAWPFLMTWTGRASALIGLFASLAGGVTWLVAHHRQQEQHSGKMALAETQVQQGDYQGAVQSYGELLKDNATYRPALDGQLSAAEQWVEDFHVTAPEGQDAGPAAAALLDQIMPILDAGLARSSGTQAADVRAHIGWAHWLNQKIAEREFGDAAEQNLHAALQLDPANVYANAMLGNWILQNNGKLSDALHDFEVAESSGRARPLVRRMELGGLVYLDQKGARAAQVKIADGMRRNGEALDEDSKRRILSFCFNPSTTERTELVESLSAVPPDDEWKTYLWLDDHTDDPDGQLLVREFIHANLLEVSGDHGGALALYRKLDQELKNSASTMIDPVQQAIARLSHG
jgi:tetratricopeptide (TPR) repeat protein